MENGVSLERDVMRDLFLKKYFSAIHYYPLRKQDRISIDHTGNFTNAGISPVLSRNAPAVSSASRMVTSMSR